MQDCKRLYNEIANEYLAWQNKNIDYLELARNYVDFASRAHKSDRETSYLNEGVILELGCSVGDMAFAFAELGYKVIGVDFSDKMIELANKRLESSKYKEQIEFVTADFCADKFVQEIQEVLRKWNMDIVFSIACLDTLNHLSNKDLEHFFANLSQLCRENTLFAFDILSEAYFYEVLTQNYTEDLGDSYLIWENNISENPLENQVKLVKFEKVKSSVEKNAAALFSKTTLKLDEYFYEPKYLTELALRNKFETLDVHYTVSDDYYDLGEEFGEVERVNSENDGESFESYFADNLPMRFFLLMRKM